MSNKVQGVITSPVVTKSKISIPYIIIIPALVFCLPLGIFFMKLRIDADRSAIFQERTTMTVSISAWTLLILSGVFILIALNSNASSVAALLFIALLFCIPGLCANGYALYLKKTRALYKRYIELVVNNEMTDLNAIAQQAGVDVIKLVNGLTTLISHGNLPGAFLDAGKGTITMHHDPLMASSGNERTYAKQCPSCCANGKVVPGQNNLCEYCGTFLSS